MSTAPLVGRDSASAGIRAFIAKAAVGGGGLLVTGDPGIGKSAMLDAASRHAANAGAFVLRAEGVESEKGVSHAVLNQLLGADIHGFDSLSTMHSSALTVALGLESGPTPDRLVVANAVLALLRHRARDRPVLVVIDDLHWVDRASAFALGFVARRLADTRIAFLAGQRSAHAGFLEPAGMSRIDLPPLGDEDSSTLVRSRHPGMAPDVVGRVVAESQGVPLALLELPLGLTAGQRASEEALPLFLPLGHHLSALFAARLRELPDDSRALVLMAALAGAELLPLVSYLAVKDGQDHLAAAEDAGLLRVDPVTRRLTFTHPLIRSAVSEMATGTERRRAHQRLADLPGIHPDARARHLAEAVVEPDEEVAALVEAAAYRILGRGDPGAAVAGLVHAAELSPERTDQARRLAEAAYVGADTAGAIDDVSVLLDRARRADPDVNDSLSAAVAAAYVLLSEGDVDTAHRLLRGGIAAQAGPVPHHLMDEAHYTLLMVSFFGARPGYWRALRAALDRWPDASPILSISAATLADPARSTPEQLERLDSAIAALPLMTDPHEISRVAVAAIWVDRLDGCRAALTRVADGGTGVVDGVAVVRAELMLAISGFMAGRWDEAAGMTRRAHAHFAREPFPLLEWITWHTDALLAAGRGDETGCADACERMRQLSVPRGSGAVDRYVAHAAGLGAIGRGDYDEAFRLLASISPPGNFPANEPFALWVLLDLVEAAERSGRHDDAVRHVHAARTAGVSGISSRMALLCAGSEAIVADDESADAVFAQALSTPGCEAWPFDVARIELARGEHLRRRRRTSKARVHLEVALVVFDRLGATPWADRARAGLRATGQTRRSSLSSKPADLTPQELEIAMLGATGLTNRQIGERLFISPRTVSAHLYRIFPKLGIETRAGLRDALSTAPDPVPFESGSADVAGG